MQKKILLLLMLITSIWAFDSDENEFEFQFTLGSNPSYEPESVDKSVSFASGFLISYAVPFDDESAFVISWGFLSSAFDPDLAYYLNKGEIQYVIDLNDHRFGAGASYHYDINFLTEGMLPSTIPEFDDTFGYVVSYAYFADIDRNNLLFLNGESALFGALFYMLGLDAFTFGITYEGINYTDKLTSQNYDGSTLNFTLGFVF